MTPAKKTKSGWYSEHKTVGVNSCVVRGKGDKWEIAAPDHRLTGAYWKRIKNLTLLDLRSLCKAIEDILDATDGGAPDGGNT